MAQLKDSVVTGSLRVTDTLYTNTAYVSDGSGGMTELVKVKQGTNNTGKFMIVNSSGNIEAIQMEVWQGGNY